MLVAATADRPLSDHEHASDPDSAPDRTEWANLLRYLRIPLVRRRHVLVITSAIYVPYQFFAGAPVLLSDGADHVELVGTPTGTDGDTSLRAQRIAQEIHAAVRTATTILHS